MDWSNLKHCIVQKVNIKQEENQLDNFFSAKQIKLNDPVVYSCIDPLSTIYESCRMLLSGVYSSIDPLQHS